jgi:hypothetical protein
MNAGKHQVRLALEPLEDRCTPSGLRGGLEVPLPDLRGRLDAALVRPGQQHTIPIKITTNCFGNYGAMTASSTGFATGGIGHYTAEGQLDSISIGADQGVSHGTLTVTTANGDLLFVEFTTSWNLASGAGTHEVSITGGTGRFAGASGGGTSPCTITVDLAAQTYTCNCQGTGELILPNGNA